MKVLVIGSGAREHALAWKIAQSPLVQKLYCAPGNPGTALVAQNVQVAATDLDGLAEWAQQAAIDLTVVGPEAPLARGIVDLFEQRGLKIFGPRKEAAQLESSKAFAKDIMNSAGVPTPIGRAFHHADDAKRYLKEVAVPLVVKADGLAAGKGVIVPDSVEETMAAIEEFMVAGKLGVAGKTIVLEEKIIGREASVMAIVDGLSLIPLVVSQDYKRIFDGDQGPNTGGMGAISPTPVLADAEAQRVVQEMFVPVLEELQKRGIYYRGFLYGGLIIDSLGVPRILEFNCRLGDPETEVLLMRLESDILAVLESACSGKLAEQKLVWKEESAACVVLSARGYPGSPHLGDEIRGLDSVASDLQIFQAGTKFSVDRKAIVTDGGRVLCVSGLGKTVSEAVNRVYEGINKVSFDGMHYRRDIGGKVN